MNTTTLTVELLINGLMSISWISFFLIKSNIITLQFLENIKNYKELSILFLFVIAYVLGIVLDRIWDLLTKKIDLIIKEKKLGAKYKEKIHKIKKIIFVKKNGSEYIEYIRNRQRIARSTFLNLLMWLIMLSIFNCENKIKFIIITIFLTILSFYAYIKLCITYCEAIKIFEKE